MKIGIAGVAALLLFVSWAVFFTDNSKGVLEAANTPPPPTISAWHKTEKVMVVQKVEKLSGFEGVGWTVVQVGTDISDRHLAEVTPFRDIPINTEVHVKEVLWHNNRRHSVTGFSPRTLIVQQSQ